MSSSESSEGYLSNDMVASSLRGNSAPIVIQELYEGYMFNGEKCIQFNNRILCGYDKNRGEKLDDYTIIDLGDGCRSRGDRIECGYERKVIIRRKSHVRQAPTSTTGMTNNPPFVLKNKIKTDILEKKLLKSALALMKFVDTGDNPSVTELDPSVSDTSAPETNSSKPTSQETSSSYTLGTSTDIPIEIRLPASLETQSPESTSEKTTKSNDEITSPNTNNISSDAITKTVNLEEVSNHEEPAVQRTTMLTKILTNLPELVTESNADIGLLREQSTVNITSITNNTSDDKIKTSCVEKNDRVVCYNFKT
uniref:Uncharacterized protein n=1 Tax=Heliothis virescens TaxID=7102 RepID=A0A2A4JN88_HELVI